MNPPGRQSISTEGEAPDVLHKPSNSAAVQECGIQVSVQEEDYRMKLDISLLAVER